MSERQRNPNVILRRIREQERHETRAEFAEAMMRKAAELGEAVSPSERYIARLEDGEITYPHPAYRRVLTALCGRPITQLGFTSSRLARLSAGDRDINELRRSPSAIGRGPSSPPNLDDIEIIRRNLQAIVGDNLMSEAAIEDWEATVQQHGRATRYQPPSLLLASLTSDIADLNEALSRCRSASALRRLTRVSAHMAGLMCLTLVKMDDRSAFRRWARTARIAAGEAGDPATLAWVRAQEAYGYYYTGETEEAIDVARHAQSVTHGAPCVGAALAAALEARALAKLGRGVEANDALKRAEMILSKLDAGSIGPSAFGYSEAQLRFHEGSTLAHLRETQPAWIAQSRALELIPENDYTDRALTHLDRAICLAHDGDGTAAVAYAIEALNSLTDDQRQGIIILRANEALEVIPSKQLALPPAREFRDMLMLYRTNTDDSQRDGEE